MIRTPKRRVILRLPQTERPEICGFLAEARRRRQTPRRVETPHPLAAALITRGETRSEWTKASKSGASHSVRGQRTGRSKAKTASASDLLVEESGLL